jgi:hypothetical protein
MGLFVREQAGRLYRVAGIYWGFIPIDEVKTICSPQIAP